METFFPSRPNFSLLLTSSLMFGGLTRGMVGSGGVREGAEQGRGVCGGVVTVNGNNICEDASIIIIIIS